MTYTYNISTYTHIYIYIYIYIYTHTGERTPPGTWPTAAAPGPARGRAAELPREPNVNILYYMT